MPTLADSKYVLTEYYNGLPFNELVSILEKFLEAGHVPIIAHLERYPEIFKDIEQVKRIKDMGCLVQINCYSIVGEKSVKVSALANELLDNRLVDFIGSDAHRTYYRPPMYSNGVKVRSL